MRLCLAHLFIMDFLCSLVKDKKFPLLLLELRPHSLVVVQYCCCLAMTDLAFLSNYFEVGLLEKRRKSPSSLNFDFCIQRGKKTNNLLDVEEF